MCKVNSSLYAQCLSDADGGFRRGQNNWAPNTDVYTTDTGLVVKVELSGLRDEDLELIIDGNRLTIAGQRPDVSRQPGNKFLVMEINYGTFESVLDVPPGYDLGQARAVYQNGFLRLDVPAVPKSPSKSVLIPISEEK